MWHNDRAAVELDVQSPPSSKPLDATSDEANEPVSQLGAVDFSKGHRMSGTTASDSTTEPSVAVARPQTIREFQRALRGLGFSERQAKAVASHGFKALPGVDPEPPEDMAGLVAALKQNITSMKDAS